MTRSFILYDGVQNVRIKGRLCWSFESYTLVVNSLAARVDASNLDEEVYLKGT